MTKRKPSLICFGGIGKEKYGQSNYCFHNLLHKMCHILWLHPIFFHFLYLTDPHQKMSDSIGTRLDAGGRGRHDMPQLLSDEEAQDCEILIPLLFLLSLGQTSQIVFLHQKQRQVWKVNFPTVSIFKQPKAIKNQTLRLLCSACTFIFLRYVFVCHYWKPFLPFTSAGVAVFFLYATDQFLCLHLLCFLVSHIPLKSV